MTDDEKNAAAELVKAINHNSQWTGQTTRELRDKVDGASKQIGMLCQTIDSVSKTNSGDLAQLTASINRYSASSDQLSRRMVWLTTVLAIATVISAVAACIAAFNNK